MNAQLLSDSGLKIILPPSLGGGEGIYNQVLEINNPTPFVDFVVPASLANKKDVLVLGEAWCASGWTWKTAQLWVRLTWNNFANSIHFFGGTRYVANTKVKVEQKVSFGDIKDLKMRLSVYNTGSAGSASGWEVTKPAARCNLKLYYN
ncbi:hypothetical protein B6S12_04995 [Helicobacter valdiviensis]|uniref:Uncharacterized protein n=1 Tax=Helicobacter valdiviensis TaxID=1458358 RepID=A0A2W6MW51_9HELI|nr:hypothetical protein [Helicobacter valdiviensis]PZT48179.1 hypothetical protein B6S12_04995 [Helicobacter valdiviensis]